MINTRLLAGVSMQIARLDRRLRMIWIAIRGKRLVWAGAGGQYSMLAEEDMPMANGDL
jgi:hypothetical protein